MLLVGDTQTISHSETFSVAAMVAGASASLVRPDGTLQNDLSVSWTPTGAGTSFIFSTQVAAPLPGEYRLTWTIHLGDGQVLNRSEGHFATYTDVGALIRRRLNETVLSLPEADLDAEVTYTVRSLVDRFVPLQMAGGYGGLIGLDQVRFDRAMGLLTALRLRASRAKSVPIGEIGRVQLGQNGFQFANAQGNGLKPLEQQWLEEALIALGHVSPIHALYQSAAASYKPFVVSGPTRNAQCQGALETLASGVIRLLTDAWQVGTPPEDYAADYAE
ncbi:hypothetical protein CTKA_01688 [Chthonomonas calidirosea]|uniref:Uncharacterized protein n=1 Tax=Chthonomonas calidirosea (strain DSM 23976 / ICMP 18418 / T49) TaxID=1303518 RepID=S0EXJ7_CHTCT|nr:hypothetical protein [Chthonomonas calidirosea]CCW36210.1 hypothetical protein CCALI_02406 [Chthonomonas calidirosea T49]CEK18010.1 hypothetical protein CTKA_01688 [Chthonomonas calidirosea]